MTNARAFVGEYYNWAGAPSMKGYIPSISYHNAVLNDATYYFPIDEISGTSTVLTDVIGNSVIWNISGAQPGVSGKFNNSIGFTSGTSSMTWAKNYGTFMIGSINSSLSFWEYHSINPAAPMIRFGWMDSSSNQNGFGIGLGSINWADTGAKAGSYIILLFDGVRWVTTTQKLVPNQWNNIVLTLDNVGVPYIYYNGGLVGSFTGTVMKSPGSVSYMGIYSDKTMAGNPQNVRFTGSIDDVAIWNRTLTSTEVSNLWNGGLG